MFFSTTLLSVNAPIRAAGPIFSGTSNLVLFRLRRRKSPSALLSVHAKQTSLRLCLLAALSRALRHGRRKQVCFRFNGGNCATPCRWAESTATTFAVLLSMVVSTIPVSTAAVSELCLIPAIPVKAATPLHPAKFRELLKWHPDRKFCEDLVNKLTNGANIDFCGPHYSRSPPNAATARSTQIFLACRLQLK